MNRLTRHMSYMGQFVYALRTKKEDFGIPKKNRKNHTELNTDVVCPKNQHNVGLRVFEGFNVQSWTRVVLVTYNIYGGWLRFMRGPRAHFYESLGKRGRDDNKERTSCDMGVGGLGGGWSAWLVSEEEILMKKSVKGKGKVWVNLILGDVRVECVLIDLPGVVMRKLCVLTLICNWKRNSWY